MTKYFCKLRTSNRIVAVVENSEPTFVAGLGAPAAVTVAQNLRGGASTLSA